MRNRWFLAVALFGAALVVAACTDDDSSGSDSSATTTSGDGGGVARPGSVLHGARLDLALRLDTSPLSIELRSLQHAGWDGCLGLLVEGEACTEQFIGGYIAFFGRGEGPPFRYHLGGARFLAVDFLDGEVSDGSAVPAEIQTDFEAVLAAYARKDLGLLLEIDPATITIEAVVPAQFSDSCIGFAQAGQACDDAIAPGAFVLLQANGEGYRYHIARGGWLVATDFVAGTVTAEPDGGVIAVQRAMREDLASRLGVTLEGVSVSAYREVTWRNGCLGVQRPGDVCTEALVEGFLALLQAEGEEYRYHGRGDAFIAASFEDGATIVDPLPPSDEDGR